MLSKTHTKYIQSLLHKKFRDEYNLFIAEGPKVVMDLLESRKFTCKEIFALQDWVTGNTKRLSILTKTPVTTVVDFELEKISTLATQHQVMAVFEKGKEDAAIKTTGKITLVLDSIQDPGNLGTIIRIADWFGISDIICSEGCADMYNPKVVQSTMGNRFQRKHGRTIRSIQGRTPANQDISHDSLDNSKGCSAWRRYAGGCPSHLPV